MTHPIPPSIESGNRHGPFSGWEKGESDSGFWHLAICLILLAAFYARTWHLDFQELRGDEAFGYFFSLESLQEIAKRTISLREPHPVASYWLQSLWLDYAGHSEFALRFSSAWFSVLAVAIYYALSRTLAFGPSVTAASALLLAVNPYLIWHGQDARMYSMSLAVTAASTWLFFRLLCRSSASQDRRGKPATKRFSISIIAPYILLAWLALHTHYFAGFILVAHNVIVFIWIMRNAVDKSEFLPLWIGIQFSIGILYLPWALQVYRIVMNYGGNGDSPGMLEMLGRSFLAFAFGETISNEWLWFVAILFFAAVAISDARQWEQKAPLLTLLFVPLFATWWSARGRSLFDERYLVAAAPAFILIVAHGLIPRRKPHWPGWRFAVHSLFALAVAAGFTMGTAISLSNYYANPAYGKTIGWRALAQRVDNLASGVPPQSVRFVQNFPDPTLWYYYQGPVDHVVLPPAPHDVTRTEREVEKLVDQSVKRAILIVQPAPNWDDSSIAIQALQQQYAQIAKTQVKSWPIYVYSRIPDTTTKVDAQFRNRLQLASAGIQPTELVPGGVISIQLVWSNLLQATPQLSGSEKLFLHLVGPDGQISAQHDTRLFHEEANSDADSDEMSSPLYGILIPDDAATGEYNLIAGIYLPEQPGSPRVETMSGADSVSLANIWLHR